MIIAPTTWWPKGRRALSFEVVTSRDSLENQLRQQCTHRFGLLKYVNQFCSPCHLVWNINQLVPRLNIFKTLGSRTLTRNVICIPCSLMSINWLLAWHHRVLILGLGTSNSFKISACCVYRAVERLGGTISTTFPAHLPGSTRSGMQMYSQLVLWHLQGHRHCVEGKTLRVVTCPQKQ